ncbi:NAD(P)-binding domain-containing protein [Microbacterium sp. MEC084]|uniref:3-hydroxyacyl-CoA dehydrogenase family protein n=1 Tax=unclassified Microbacterium TaxID=2609290 RepID=UPI0006F994C1|nr:MULTISPECIES: 3-hydroxyacyl-CoA dehydrogenase family protein [unclassified Microbacterium]KQY99211.1 3-hydroxybutyryl-CoA dehydrogenase [Microbacterium sp. Root53]MCD1269144.1 NAD(P)-binding domain-containing protein [Microbacterium sp. MEC084]
MTPHTPARVGVLGGGRMGGGIAHAFLLAGSDVTVVERDLDAADAARARIEESIDRSIARGFDGNAAELRDRLTVTTDAAAFAAHGLVIEAVPEDLDLKLEALARVEAVLAADAVLASNTSSIPLARLSDGLERPERLIGLHFFNPVPASSLVEIVVGAQTAPELPEAARSWIEALGKTPITVTDSPGFASSRLGVAIALEAIRMVEEGVASPADIDLAMELGYRHPTGPLRTTDIVGLDVRLGIAEQLERELGPRFAPPRLLRDMVAEGRIGRKAGRGFYDWTEGGDAAAKETTR